MSSHTQKPLRINSNIEIELNFSSTKIQTTLLQNCWVELFIIGFAQSSHIVSIPTIMSSLINFMNNAIGQEKMPANKLKKMAEHIWKVNDFIQEITKMDVDDVEFALLRFIVLFNPGKCQSKHAQFQPKSSCTIASLSDNSKIDAHQRVKMSRIQDFYIKTFVKQKQQSSIDSDATHAGDETFVKIAKLLLKLNTLRSLDPELIEELFFTNLIGQVLIDNVIPHILNLGNNCAIDST